MYLQVLHLYDPDRFPANEPARSEGFEGSD
jgi:hypothetical protein